MIVCRYGGFTSTATKSDMTFERILSPAKITTEIWIGWIGLLSEMLQVYDQTSTARTRNKTAGKK